MEWDKEKEMLEQLCGCHKRVYWLLQQLDKSGNCPPDRDPAKDCSLADNCFLCWLFASGRAVKKGKEDAPQA